MATFLELCRHVARESGTLAGGASLATVADATGRALKVVEWVRQAWVDIQNERTDWKWMRLEFSHALTTDRLRYTADDLGLTRFSAWLVDRPGFSPFTLYDPDIGQTDENAIRLIDYDVWRARYDRGSHDAQRPTFYAVSPSLQLCLGAKADKAYMLRGEYRPSPQILAVDNDTPEMPVQHHMLIVDEALKLMAESDEDLVLPQTTVQRVRGRRFALVREQLPPINLHADALA